jgi:hypothetical protein
MIRFSCRCKYVFEVPEDAAGSQIQCPNCHLLVDVPSIEELSGIGDDGSYRMSAPPQASNAETFEQMRRVYGKEKLDEDGDEIDLRQTHEQFLAAGTEDHYEDFTAGGKTAPKYDPETGELLRPHDIVELPRIEQATPPEDIPVATPTLNYASAGLQSRCSLFAPFVQLAMPINLAAMFFVMVAHLFIIMASFAVITSFLALIIVGTGIVAHYGAVIEEIGIEERDEIPRFMRHFNIADDIWLPFARVFLAWMICFGPGFMAFMIYLGRDTHAPWLLLAIPLLDLVGVIFFPAIVLITTTSGSLSNLHPVRVLGTIGKIGARYAFFVMLYMAAITVYFFGLLLTPDQLLSVFHVKSFGAWFVTGLIAWGTLAAGIYLMHWFAWLLGMEYRTGHMGFPWVYQKFERYIPGVTGPRWSKHADGGVGLARRRAKGFPVQPVSTRQTTPPQP